MTAPIASPNHTSLRGWAFFLGICPGKAPNPTRRTPNATASTPTTAPADTPSFNAIAPKTRTTTRDDRGDREQGNAPEKQTRGRGARVPRPREQHIPPRVKERGAEREGDSSERHAGEPTRNSGLPAGLWSGNAEGGHRY